MFRFLSTATTPENFQTPWGWFEVLLWPVVTFAIWIAFCGFPFVRWLGGKKALKILTRNFQVQAVFATLFDVSGLLYPLASLRLYRGLPFWRTGGGMSCR